MLQKIVKHPSLIYAEDIKSICQPLQKLNINYFAHVHIDKHNLYSAISSHPEYAKHYLSNKCYNVDIHRADLSKLGNQIIWDAFELSQTSAIEHKIAVQFGIEHIFTLVDREQDGMHYYHFGSNILGKAINQIYIANIDLLRLFICHFKEKILQRKNLCQAYNIKFLIDEETEGFSIKTDSTILNQQEIKSAFLKDIRMISPSIKSHTTLSMRELEILRWLHHGKTANDIATILQIADITVNKHIANIKQKTKCYTQFQLGEFYSANIF